MGLRRKRASIVASVVSGALAVAGFLTYKEAWPTLAIVAATVAVLAAVATAVSSRALASTAAAIGLLTRATPGTLAASGSWPASSWPGWWRLGRLPVSVRLRRVGGWVGGWSPGRPRWRTPVPSHDSVT